MPPDGFYPPEAFEIPDDDADCIVMLVSDLNSKFSWLCGYFLPPVNQDLEGTPGFVDLDPSSEIRYTYTYADFGIPNPITKDNYIEAFERISDGIRKLVALVGNSGFSEGQKIGVHDHAFGCECDGTEEQCDVPGPEENCCELALDLWVSEHTADYFWRNQPTAPGDIEVHETVIRIERLEPVYCCHLGDCELGWWDYDATEVPIIGGTIDSQSFRAKVKTWGLQLPYTVKAYGRIPPPISPMEIGSRTPPIAADDMYHLIASGNGQGELVSPNYVEANGLGEEGAPLTWLHHGCAEYPEFDYEECFQPYFRTQEGWNFDPYVLSIVWPVWDTAPDEGSCADDEQIDDPRQETGSPETEGGEAGCGDPGASVSGPPPGPGHHAFGENQAGNPAAAAGLNAGFPSGYSSTPLSQPYPTSHDPVSLETGNKLEHVDDVVVPLIGRDFRITRGYSSRYSLGQLGLVGHHWSMSVFQFAFQDPNLGNAVVLDGWPVDNVRVFSETGPGSGRWEPGGASNEFIEQSTVSAGGIKDTWRLAKSGGWERHLFRAGGANPPGSEYEGLTAREQDVYGNTVEYRYQLIGPQGSQHARLVNIQLDPAEGTDYQSASVVFDWNPGSQANGGKLKSIIVYQKTTSGVAVMTQRVDYVHKSGTADHEGSAGDMVQVTKYVLVDKPYAPASSEAAKYHVQVTQYRYHTGVPPLPSADERLSVAGGAGQLKAVFQAEQIEFLAEKLTRDGGPGAAWSPADAVLQAAAHLRTKADGADTQDGDGRIAIDYAAKILSYETEPAGQRRVLTQYLQTGCGCGTGAHGLKQVYSYLVRGADPTVRIAQFQYWGVGYVVPHLTIYYDMAYYNGMPYLDVLAIMEPGPPGRHWVWRILRDPGAGHVVNKLAMPSAVSTYQPAGEIPPYNVVVSDTSGLVVQYEYTPKHRLTSVKVGRGLSLNELSTLVRITYDGARPWLPSIIERYRDGASLGLDDVETTLHEYGFHGTGDAIAYVRTKVESELPIENGRSSGSTTEEIHELYDSRGLNRWTCHADRTLSYRGFDKSQPRLLIASARNASLTTPAGDISSALLPSQYGNVDTSGWGQGPGGELVTRYAWDALGRVLQRTRPGDVNSYTIRELRAGHERSGVAYLAEVSLPHKLPDGSFDGPAAVSLGTAAGGPVEDDEYEVSTTDPYDPIQQVYTLGNQLARRTFQSTLAGQTERSREWHDVPANRFNETSFGYDTLGRLERAVSPGGTITRNTYDSQGRIVEVKIGTSDGTPSNMVAVAQYFYDHTGSVENPAQGQGDGNLTLIQLLSQESPSIGQSPATRKTVRDFDFRGRILRTTNPDPPHEYVIHDNLGRVRQRGLFDQVPVIGTGSGEGINSPGRGLFTESLYSQRGLVYRQRVAIDPQNPTAGFLEVNRWFDPEGRVVAEWSPNSPGLKRTFDGHGRTVSMYVTDRGELSNGVDEDYEDAVSRAGDRVLEQTVLRYNAIGLLDLVTTLHRLHDSTDTGDLSNGNAVATYVGYYYDGANRRIRTVNFGTNLGTDPSDNVFKSGGSVPIWPPSSPPNWSDPAYADTTVTSDFYNTRGLLHWRIDPQGRVTRFLFDDLSRRFATIENYADAVVSWDPTPGIERWKVTGINDAEPDVDRVTTLVYDGDGHVAKQVAHLPAGTAEKVQVTQYVYGTSIGTAGDETDTLVASNDLLAKVHYPNETTGEADQAPVYTVQYSYNAQGELRSVTDQNSTRHKYLRDGFGRLTLDSVAATGPGIDGSIRSIGVSYDGLGRLDRARSYTDQQGIAVKNAVRFRYTPLWQVSKIYQDHNGDIETTAGDDGPPSGDTNVVAYEYATSTSGNYSRVSALTYPRIGAATPAVESFKYGAVGSLDDRISRLASMTATDVLFGLDFAAYSYLGVGMVAVVDYPVPDIQLDRTFSHDGKRRSRGQTSQQQGLYPGWDRFGRVQRQTWIDGLLSTNNDSSAFPNWAPIVEETHTYDKASNRLDKADARPGAKWTNRDFDYDYDGLDRLTRANRGIAGSPFTNGVGGQEWVLDMLGNWDVSRTNNNGNPSFTDTGEVDTRTHDAANQLTQRAIPGQSGSPFPLTYDDAGNMATYRTSGLNNRLYTHDAWNRLVRVQNQGNFSPPPAPYTIGEYEYNALHWRTLKRADSKLPNGLDQQRAFWYSASWQVLQEDIDDHPNNGTPDGVNMVAQEFYGPRYIDEAVMRRLDGDATHAPNGVFTDAEDRSYWHLNDVQFSSIAMVASNGRIAERVSYSAYGVGSHRYGWDVNNDGACGATTDRQTIVNLAAAGGLGTTINDPIDPALLNPDFDAAADLDRNGIIDTADVAAWDNPPYAPPGNGVRAALAAGLISDPAGADNPFGYDGYVFNGEIRSNLARFRWQDPGLGRWVERDPLGQSAGMSLYQFCSSRPVVSLDPLGLADVGRARMGDPNAPAAPAPCDLPCPAPPKTCLAIASEAGYFANVISTLEAEISKRKTDPGYTGHIRDFPDTSDADLAAAKSAFEARIGELRADYDAMRCKATAPQWNVVNVPNGGQQGGTIYGSPAVSLDDWIAGDYDRPVLSEYMPRGYTPTPIDTVDLSLFAPVARAGAAAAAGAAARGAGAAADSTLVRLQAHLDAAINRFATQGYTRGQAARLATNPKLGPAFRGERIDTFFKEAVAGDTSLSHLKVTPRFKCGPDVIDPRTGRWYDVTTFGQWPKHVSKYGPNGTGLIYK